MHLHKSDSCSAVHCYTNNTGATCCHSGAQMIQQRCAWRPFTLASKDPMVDSLLSVCEAPPLHGSACSWARKPQLSFPRTT